MTPGSPGDRARLTELLHSPAVLAFRRGVAEVPVPPSQREGRGVVIPAGGSFFVGAYVSAAMLRWLGCRLPIELWHLGAAEVTPDMRRAIERLNVRCVDALQLHDAHPIRTLGGWQLKPFSLLHCSFRHALLLDADNVPVVDPTFLFDSIEYRKNGSIFWPDRERIAPTRSIWALTGVSFRDEPEFESGQVVVDVVACWHELNLTMCMNEHGEFWYQHIYGDKDTFHMAWRKLGRSYAMPRREIEVLPGTFCQHDFSGRRVFQHRNRRKWSLDGPNPKTTGFCFEDRCLGYIDQLRRELSEQAVEQYEPALRSIHDAIVRRRRYVLVRQAQGRTPLEFLPDLRIGLGRTSTENRWCLSSDLGERPKLLITGDAGITAELTEDGIGTFRGRATDAARTPVRLLPLDGA
jgi:hypothetical protein